VSSSRRRRRERRILGKVSFFLSLSDSKEQKLGTEKITEKVMTTIVGEGKASR